MSLGAVNVHDAALGALLGACVGDAAGATLEFLGHPPSATEVQQAMQMPGGGIWQVAPGQITDDGELTLCLAQALSRCEQFDLEAIARFYAEWIRSTPFDIGYTTANSLGCFNNSDWLEICIAEGYARGMTRAAASRCMGSKANGSLMRAVPLGIWGYQLSEGELVSYAIADSCLSHPNPSCCHAVAAYVLAIAHLLRVPGDRAGAFGRAEAWVQNHAVAEVQNWLQDARQHERVPYSPQDGFVKIAFTHAFRHLHQGTGYREAIRETLAGGGDTDTNACIVGGLIGAADGVAEIPERMQRAVLNCDTTLSAHPRPRFLQTTHLAELLNRLLDNALQPSESVEQ